MISTGCQRKPEFQSLILPYPVIFFWLKSACHGVFTPKQEFSIVHSQIYMAFINQKKCAHCPKHFISLHYFKQHTRCDPETQYFSEKASGRRSPDRVFAAV